MFNSASPRLPAVRVNGSTGWADGSSDVWGFISGRVHGSKVTQEDEQRVLTCAGGCSHGTCKARITSKGRVEGFDFFGFTPSAVFFSEKMSVSFLRVYHPSASFVFGKNECVFFEGSSFGWEGFVFDVPLRVLSCLRFCVLGWVSASSVHAEFGSSVHAGPDRLCTRAFFAPDRLYTQCLLLCTRRDRGGDSCMFPCLSVV